ncbi:uncharacterized protein LOC115801229 [Archocentrus centrarchus]|uniref:uncharacterized protein LOC115801229 n=1 Tax=Archocentrus centrarchus TaxID=63155 RepID=UPI0011EA35DB|nr:uncharacterized protein LOC115801229 [Archocentrus centrarchus]
MEDLSRYLGFNKTLALICWFIFIFLQADGTRICKTAGSPVTLNCSNNLIISFTQLTWKRNGDNLFTFRSDGTSNSSCVTLNSSQKASNIRCVRSHAAAILNLNMSTSESQLYALIIESAQKTHTGNYSCETSMIEGILEQKWELIIDDDDEESENPFKIHISAAVIIPCVCFLIIITVLIILTGVCKRCSQNTKSPSVIKGQQEDIYENTLELEAHHRRSQIQVQPYKYRAE